MPKWMSAEWHDRYKELAESQPDRPGATIFMQYVITGGPDGDIKYWSNIKDGKIVDQQVGESPDAEVTLTTSHADAVAIQKGELDANAAFMQGRVKVGGEMGTLMSLLPITGTAEYKKLQEDIRAETEF
jgi:predicted lipid carrier protein YhbT